MMSWLRKLFGRKPKYPILGPPTAAEDAATKSQELCGWTLPLT